MISTFAYDDLFKVNVILVIFFYIINFWVSKDQSEEEKKRTSKRTMKGHLYGFVLSLKNLTNLSFDGLLKSKAIFCTFLTP